MQVILSKLAKCELHDTSELYELEQSGLGKRFRQEIKTSIQRIVQHPLAWSLETAEVRKYVLHKFPYKILCFFSRKGCEKKGRRHKGRRQENRSANACFCEADTPSGVWFLKQKQNPTTICCLIENP